MSGAHETKEYTIFQIAMNLAAACLVSGVIIALVYYFTAPIATEKSAMLKTQAMKALVKSADKFEPVEGKKDWFAAEKDGKIIDYIVPGESKGFGGAIKMLVAVTADGKVEGYSILAHNETPGLGDNADKAPFKNQFIGKVLEKLVVVKDPAQSDKIQAMTGATISSRAVTKGIAEAVEEVVKFQAEGGK